MFRYALSMILTLLLCGWFASLNGYGDDFSGNRCSFYRPSLREQWTHSDSIMIATWSKAPSANAQNGDSSKARLMVIEVIKEPKQESENIKLGKIIRESKVQLGSEGERVLVFGNVQSDESYRYSLFPKPLTEALLDYLRQIPSVDAKPAVQLAYFAKHFESPDPMVAEAAFYDFSMPAEMKDLVEIRDHLSPDKLRQWLTNPQTDSHRIGMYGFLLGLVGNETDIQLLREISLRPVQEFGIGADRLFTGYLMLAGVQGLEVLEEAKLKNKTAPFSEAYATMQALRFMWTYGDGRISKDRLRQSMRIILDRPELADLVIIDLGRWQDWSVSDKLMELYGQAGYDIPSTKRAIVRFFLTEEAAKPKDPKESLPEHVITAQKHLKTLREKDPETVKAAEEFFYLNF